MTNKNMRYIYSENQEKDIWDVLLIYSIKNNIKNYLNDNNKVYTEELAEAISGSLIQAKEYFTASNHCSINTSPLLLYYGSINLLFAFSCLLKGEIINARSHGMELGEFESEDFSILSCKIHLKKNNDSGFKNYYETLNNVTIGTEETSVSIKDLMLSLPELSINHYFSSSNYSNELIPLKRVISDDLVYYKVDRTKTLASTEDLCALIANVDGYNDSYFRPNIYKEQISFKKKFEAPDIVKKSYHGNYYLQVDKGRFSFPYDDYLMSFVALYGLATLCRYHTKVWTPFVREDSTGELGIVTKFVETTRRYLPNKILDIVQNGTHIFSQSLDEELDMRKHFRKEDFDRIKKDVIKSLG